MNTFPITKALRDLYLRRDESGWAVNATAEDLRDHYPDLSPEAAQAIIERRIDVLAAWGVHPMSLIQMSRVLHFPIETRWQDLSAAEERR